MRTHEKKRLLRTAAAVLSAVLLMLLASLETKGVYAGENDIRITYRTGSTVIASGFVAEYARQVINGDPDNTCFCIDPEKTRPPEGTYKIGVPMEDQSEFGYRSMWHTVTRANSKAGENYGKGGIGIGKVLYYSVGQPGWDTLRAAIPAKYRSEANAYFFCHIVLSYASSVADGADNGWTHTYNNSIYAQQTLPAAYQSDVKAAYNAIRGFDAVPVGWKWFYIYALESIQGKAGAAQRIVGSLGIASGELELLKESSNAAAAAAAGYSLKGAVYNVYSDEALKKSVGRLTTVADGTSNTIADIDPGTYYIKEQSAPPGFKLDEKTHRIAVEAGKTAVLRVKDDPETASVRILKEAGDVGLTEGNGCYSLAGAEYRVYTDKACTKIAVTPAGNEAVLTTGASGNSNARTLLFGTYYVRETKASPGYALDPEIRTVKLTEADKTYTVKSVELPQCDAVELILEKISRETGIPAPQGAASLAGAEFSVSLYGKYYDTPEAAEGSGKPLRTWLFRTDESGRIDPQSSDSLAGGELYKAAASDKTVFPLGTYVIREVAAPEGYLLNEDAMLVKLKGNGSRSRFVELWPKINVPESVKRGDLEFVKLEDRTERPLAGVAFLLTCNETGESHVVVTDDQGRFSSSASPHSLETNANDAAYDGSVIDDSKLSAGAGMWFSSDASGNVSPPEDERGALVYGTYSLRELRCEANRGLDLIDELRIDITSGEGFTVNAGILTDTWKQPEIRTEAVDANTGCRVGVAGQTGVTDRISFSGLIPGREYVIRGKLMDRESGKAVKTDGYPVTAERKFIAKESSGSVSLTFPLDASSLAGRSVVAFEDLYMDEVKAATHSDLNDEAQTVCFPAIDTVLSGEGGGKSLISGGEMTVVDKVEYRNLEPGRRYRIEGALIIKETGEKLKRGIHAVRGETVFEAEPSGCGETAVSFEVDAEKLGGYHIVACETLLDENGVVLVDHEDPEDEDQTVYLETPPGTAPATGDGDAMLRHGMVLLISLEALLITALRRRRRRCGKGRFER